MFGNNQIAKFDRTGDGLTLKVVTGSPFMTIQGEGPYAGHPAIFIRLNSCHLRCTFCDTKFDSPHDPIMSIDEILTDVKVAMQSHHGVMPELIVLTGGEPLVQNIDPLVYKLTNCHYTVQIETAGTFWRDGLEKTDIVVSPKTPIVHQMIARHAKAWKYVISADMEFTPDGVPITATQPGARPAPLAAPEWRKGLPIYYSPMDEYDEYKNAANRAKVAEMAMKHNRIAGVQLHKILAIDEPI